MAAGFKVVLELFDRHDAGGRPAAFGFAAERAGEGGGRRFGGKLLRPGGSPTDK
ncbi:MAG: hypothetical protein U0736_07760 [Gemmataceae bacterium]